jgi:thiol-disulfide isomerase/thioredoxin
LSYRLDMLGTSIQSEHDSVEVAVGGGFFDAVHDQSMLVSELRANVEYGVTASFGIAAQIPLRIIDTSIVYRDKATREPIELQDPDVHHRNETLFGIADPWVQGHYATAFGGLQVDVRAGVSIPLGKTEEDPFALGRLGMEHQHVQFGTGTFNPVVGVDAVHRFGAWSLGGFAFTQQMLYENSKGWHPGDRYAGGVSAMSPLGTERWMFRTGAELQVETSERWSGSIPDQEGNQGRQDVLIVAGATVRVGEHATLSMGLKVPVLTHLENGQLEYPVVLEVGFGGAFEIGGGGADGHDHGDDDHDHDHGDEHGDEHGDGDGDGDGDGEDPDLWVGVDLVHVARNGEAVELVPVPGKITVFDFWATWCKPCKELDVHLAALAKQHPDRIAIRKVNIVDWDSEASARYLLPGKFSLPHVKVYGADGALLFEVSGAPDADPEALARRVADALSD